MTKITLDVHQFPCLNDNYGYLVHEAVSGQTAAIDTPDADKYLAEAKRKGSRTRPAVPFMARRARRRRSPASM